MRSTIDRQVLTCIEALYDAAVDQRKLEQALRTINHSLDADGCHLVHLDKQDPSLDMSLLFSEGPILWNDDLARKFQNLIYEDPRILLANSLPEKPISCRAYLTDEELHSSRVYQEVLRFSKAEYTLGINLPGSNDMVVTGFALFRAPGKQPFDQESCDFLGELVPHIKRLFVITKKLATINLDHCVSTEALDQIPVGIFVVNKQLHIRFANQSGRELCHNAEKFCAGSSQLVVYNPNEHNQLQRLVTNAVSAQQGKATSPPQAINLSGDGLSNPLTAMVSSLSLANLPLQADILGQSLAVIFVTDPRKPQEAPPDLLRRMFGLTRREAEMVERMVMGQSLQEAADFLGMSDETARSHIKAVFAKTHTSRQAEVVGLVLSSPVWIQKAGLKPNSRTLSDCVVPPSPQSRILGIYQPIKPSR